MAHVHQNDLPARSSLPNAVKELLDEVDGLWQEYDSPNVTDPTTAAEIKADIAGCYEEIAIKLGWRLPS